MDGGTRHEIVFAVGEARRECTSCKSQNLEMKEGYGHLSIDSLTFKIRNRRPRKVGDMFKERG